MSERFELTLTRIIPAPREAVFDAWLDPKALARFIKPVAGMGDCDVEVDPREGGAFLIIMKAGEKEMPHRGTYQTIRPHEKLVFTWLSDYTIPGSTVTLTFAERGPDETELTLHHAGFPDGDARDNHHGGWGEIITQLARLIG